MAVILRTPTGEKVRTTSNRRFIVVAVYRDGRARVEKRSDNLSVALKAAGSQDFIFDTAFPDRIKVRVGRQWETMV
jgi:hypothetical protein